MELNFKVLNSFYELEGKTIDKVVSAGWSDDYLIFKTTNNDVLVIEGKDSDVHDYAIEEVSIDHIKNNLKNDEEWMDIFSNLKLFDKDVYLKELEKQREIKRKGEEERKRQNDLKLLQELLVKYKDQM